MGDPTRCPYSGLLKVMCKVSDLCDCFDFPEADAQAGEILANREKSRVTPPMSHPMSNPVSRVT